MEIEAALGQFTVVEGKHQGSVYPESKMPRLNFSSLRQLFLGRPASTYLASTSKTTSKTTSNRGWPSENLWRKNASRGAPTP